MRSKPSIHAFVALTYAVTLVVTSTALAEPTATAPAAQEPAAPSQLPQKDTLTTVEARIVGQEHGNLVIDVGARLGAATKDKGELWRPVQMRHPVTKRMVEDRYRIGWVVVTEALQVMSFAKAEGETRQEPRAGDIVVLHVRRPVPAPGAAPAKPGRPEPAAPQRDPDAESVVALMESLRGQVLAARVERIDAWLRANQRNRYAATLYEEFLLLRRLSAGVGTEQPGSATFGPASEAKTSAAESSPRASSPGTRAFEQPRVQRFQPPLQALSGAPLDIGIDITGDLKGVILHSRHAGEVGYESTPMRPAGADFWVATVAGDRVREPGLDYFIEIVRVDGVAAPAVGLTDAPLHVEVSNAPKPEPPLGHRSTASVYTDYADYNLGHANDRAWQTEGFLGMRFQEVGLRALRTGFGVYRGVGGSVDDLDVQGLAPRSVGLTYGYLEGEAGLNQTLSFIARGAVGLRDDGVSGGGQLHVRIGSDLDTNIMLGGEILGGIGLRGIAQVAFLPESRVPFLVRIEVTNQPGGEVSRTSALPGESDSKADVAGRLILQGGYRILPPLVVFVRASYQGRTIVHAGPGVGGGATFEW